MIGEHLSYDLPDLTLTDIGSRRFLRPYRLLFVCTGNSCRSQMAEAWARVLLGDACEPCSAGISAHGLDAHAVTVMAEAGVDISHGRAKTVAEFRDRPLDCIITLSERARLQLPYAGHDAPAIHAGFDAPRRRQPAHATAGDGLDEYRRVRDGIRAFVAALWNAWPAVTPAPAPVPGPQSNPRATRARRTAAPVRR